MIAPEGNQSSAQSVEPSRNTKISTSSTIRTSSTIGYVLEDWVTNYTEHVDEAAGSIRLAYEQAGPASEAPPMLFVHGACCDRSYFEPQFTHFAGERRVAAVDLRGHGESDRPDTSTPGAYGVEAFADDVLAVSAAAGFDRPIVVGHSLGGLVALACAARPDAVRAVVLVDPAPIYNDHLKAFFARTVDDMAADEDGSWRREFVSGMFPPSDTYRREDTITGFASMPTAIAAQDWRAVADFNGPETLSKVHVPVLAAYAREPEPELRTHPNVTTGQTIGSGHFNQLQVPEQVNAMITRFIETTAM
ncbi:alpha/beta fold hydrolase [Streptomyces sp. NPDC057654]|uniref:alpha/beta fold hydrolase n=1 Tax=Streptomyces sp. NPDC057654 TaxID=3346196 RepID=UPI003679721F